MPSEKETIWLELIKAGKFKVTEKGEVINLTTLHELDKENKAYNGCISFSMGNKKVYTIRKIRAIWIALNGPVPDGFMVSPKDGNVKNTHKDNLKLITLSEKNQLAYERNTKVGFRVGNTIGHRPRKTPDIERVKKPRKLNDAIVIELRKFAPYGGKNELFGWVEKYKCSRQSIVEAIQGKTFKHLNEKYKPFAWRVGRAKSTKVNTVKPKQAAKPKVKTIKPAKAKPVVNYQSRFVEDDPFLLDEELAIDTGEVIDLPKDTRTMAQKFLEFRQRKLA